MLPFEVQATEWSHDSGYQVQAGHTYRFAVEGQWADDTDPMTPANGLSPDPGGVRAWMGWAKRLPAAPWMALLVRSKGPDGTSPWRLLGAGGDLKNLPRGELQFCANDVLGFYHNNHGALQVTVIDLNEYQAATED